MTIFNIQQFKQILDGYVEKNKLSPETQRYYLSCIRSIDQKLRETVSEPGGYRQISPGQVEDSIIALCKNNAQISKYLAAVRKYEKEVLGREKILLYGEPLARLTTFCKTPMQGKPLSLPESTYSKKYNRLENKKLKLAFRLQEKSGLRVSELADLRPDDISFNQDGSILIHVRNGKGRKSRQVRVINDEYLYQHLQEHIQGLENEKSLFYSAAYLRKKAAEYKMETHDLRRINSRKRYREAVNSGKSKQQAHEEVAAELGHEDIKTTRSYIHSDD